MTAFDKFKNLQAAATKEMTDLKKKREEARAIVAKATATFQKLDEQVQEMERLLGATGAAPALVAAKPVASVTPTLVATLPAGSVRLKKDGTPAKKPGPSGSAKAASKPAATMAQAKKPEAKPAKPAKKPEAKPAPAKKSGKTQKTRAAEGRRAVLAGERPTLKEAMKQVMGKSVLNSQQVYDMLKEKGWLPNSNEPKNYIGYSLSSMKAEFERVPDKGRGFYRVRGSSTNGASKAERQTSPADDALLADAASILGVN